MKGFKKFNINDYVRVKLTPEGIKTLISFYNGGHFTIRNEQDVKRFFHSRYNLRTHVLEAQLHEIMHIFGPECFVGGDTQFFENCIYFHD